MVDHADIFEDLKHIQKHFHQLIRIVPQIGKILVNDQDENIKQTLAMGVWSEIENFNSEQSLHIKKSGNYMYLKMTDRFEVNRSFVCKIKLKNTYKNKKLSSRSKFLIYKT